MKPSLFILRRLCGLSMYVAAATIGALFYYGVVGQFPNGFMAQYQNRSDVWKQRVWDTYTYLLYSLIVTAVSVLYYFNPTLELNATTTILVLALLALAFMTVMPSSLKTSFAIVNFLVIGPAISSIGPYFISIAAGYTLALTVLLTVIALLATTNLHTLLSDFLFRLYIVVTVATVFIIVVGPPSNLIGLTILCTSLYGGIILFSGMFLVSTQSVFRGIQINEMNPQQTMLHLYSCTLHLFFRLSFYLILNRMATSAVETQ